MEESHKLRHAEQGEAKYQRCCHSETLGSALGGSKRMFEAIDSLRVTVQISCDP